jgi:hypothetical protein
MRTKIGVIYASDMSTLSLLEDKALLASLHALVGSHRRVTSDIVAHLGEVDERRLHVNLGFSSLFDYCLKELRFSEDEAYRRIDVARLARRFPPVLTALEQGKASLSALALLKPHLNGDNCAELLPAVSDVSVRIAKERLAARFPLPAVPDSVRKLPAGVGASSRGERTDLLGSAELPVSAPKPDRPEGAAVPQRVCEAGPGCDAPVTRPPLTGPLPRATLTSMCPLAPAQATVEPVAQDRFLVKVTLTRSVRDKLELARDL